MTDSEWLTWDEAAELVGCPVPTIDWHKRTGRIVSRGRRARSLQRASVEEFAEWWWRRQVAREQRREVQSRPRRAGTPPEPTGWLTTGQVADLLGVSTTHAVYLVNTDQLPATRVDRRFWVREDDARAVLETRSRWISMDTAATIIGVSSTTVAAYVRAGLITQRPNPGRTASLDRASVERYAAQHRAQAEKRKAEHQARRAVTGPPRDGQVWLDTTTTALVLSISTTRVRQLARAGRLPVTKRGGQLWFARHHIEQRAAARALTQARS